MLSKGACMCVGEERGKEEVGRGEEWGEEALLSLPCYFSLSAFQLLEVAGVGCAASVQCIKLRKSGPSFQGPWSRTSCLELSAPTRVALLGNSPKERHRAPLALEKGAEHPLSRDQLGGGLQAQCSHSVREIPAQTPPPEHGSCLCLRALLGWAGTAH